MFEDFYSLIQNEFCIQVNMCVCVCARPRVKMDSENDRYINTGLWRYTVSTEKDSTIFDSEVYQTQVYNLERNIKYYDPKPRKDSGPVFTYLVLIQSS